MRYALLPLMLLAGCPSSDDKDGTDDTNVTDDTGDTGSGDCNTADCAITVDEPYVGDLSCFDGTNWGLGQEVGAGCSDVMLSLDSVIEDFQEEEPVPGASLKVWYLDDVEGSADVSEDADDNGNLTIEAPACTPTAYLAYTPPEWEETVDTYEVHQVYGVDETSATFNSVSVATSSLIPALLGLEWEPGTAIIAGTAYDCNEDGIMNAQVFIHDADGHAPPDAQIRYFANGLPNSDQPYTNDDGLWSAINVPPGLWVVDVYVWDGTQHMLIGSTGLNIQPDSVNISNIYTGIDDGIYYPASCLASCE